MHDIKLYARLEKTVVRLAEYEEQAGDIVFEKLTLPARERLAGHRKTGDHRITQTQGNVDHFVNLEGESAMAVEIGHHNVRTGEFTDGIHVLGKTAEAAETGEGSFSGDLHSD